MKIFNTAAGLTMGHGLFTRMEKDDDPVDSDLSFFAGCGMQVLNSQAVP